MAKRPLRRISKTMTAICNATFDISEVLLPKAQHVSTRLIHRSA